MNRFYLQSIARLNSRFVARFKERFPRSWLAGMVLSVGLILSSLTAYFSYTSTQLANRYRFDRISQEITGSIVGRFQTYQNAILQTRGLFQIEDQLTRDSFKTYTENMNLPVEYPGIMGLGYTVLATPGSIEQIEKQIATDYQNPNLKVWPRASSEIKAMHESAMIVRFFEPEMAPVSGRSVTGYDVSAEPNHLLSFDQARDSGQPVLSTPLQLVQDPSSEQAGYLLIVPIYRSGRMIETVEQRREALIGFIYAAFRAGDLFNAVFARSDRAPFSALHHVGFEVHDPFLTGGTLNKSSLIYSNGRSPIVPNAPAYSAEIPISVGGRAITVRAYALPGFVPMMDGILPIGIFMIGTFLTATAYRMLRLNHAQAEKLLKSERQLRLVTDSLPVLVSYVDTEMRFLFLNKSYEEWYRVQREKYIGRPVKELLGQENFDRVSSYAVRALCGEPVSFDSEILLPDGTNRPAHVSYIPDFGTKGRVKGYVTLVSDMTERRKQEKDHQFLADLSAVLNESLDVDAILKRFASLIVPTLGDLCIVDSIDDGGEIRRKAVAGESDKDELLNEIRAIVIDPKSDAPVARAVRTGAPVLQSVIRADQFNSTTTSEREYSTLKALGQKSMMVVPLKAQSRVLGAVTIISTQPRRIYGSDDLALAMDVARRAALAVDNAQLYREAQRASRTKDEFLATLSHELRTPMNVILGWLEILGAEGNDPETFQQALTTLDRNARVQIQLINDLLDISRIISGKLSLKISETDIVPSIRAGIDSIRPAARAKNITIEANLPHAETKIDGDADRIQQVVWNLLSNAVKFTPEGGRIAVSVESTETHLRFKVEDNGQGIEPHFLPFVFDRFRQEDGSTTRSQGGLGLGLSIVRYLTELHGGAAEAQSKGRGKGASFIITLPRRPEVAPSNVSDERSQGKNTIERLSDIQPVLNGIRVLLVDDSPDVRTLISRILSRAGADVKSVESAAEAFAAFTAERPHILISDIGLPHEDGFSLIKRLREFERTSGSKLVPAAALTAYAQESDAKRAIESGYDCHIAKPVAAGELLKNVASLVGFEQAPHATVEAASSVAPEIQSSVDAARS